MKLNPFVQSLLTFMIRRGLTVIGFTAEQVSDDWITKTLSIMAVAGNEGFQWWQAHKKAKPTPATVPDAKIQP
jgi:hypothetical protein